MNFALRVVFLAQRDVFNLWHIGLACSFEISVYNDELHFVVYV